MIQHETKKTPLYDIHIAAGAKMALFGGYEMPVWYYSAKKEHLCVLTGAGIFDTSHMSVLIIEGDDAYKLLQTCFTKDLCACTGREKKPLPDGRSVYGVFLKENGFVVDDTIIYQLEKSCYMAVVNAGMGSVVARYLNENKNNLDVVITDLTDRVGKIDIQGPFSARILRKVLSCHENLFESFPYFSFKGHFDPISSLSEKVRLLDDTPVLLSRTGYTGEFGFEIFVDPLHIAGLWEMIVNAGSSLGSLPCGLAARDSLRAGALLPLSHQDIGDWPFINHPWHFALPFNFSGTEFTKSFVGDKALINIDSPEYTYPFAGYDVRKVSVSDQAVVLDLKGNFIGSVLTCVTEMGIGRHNGKIYSIASPDKPDDFVAKGLCCGFVKVRKVMEYGQAVELKDDRRKIVVEIVNDIRPDRTARSSEVIFEHKSTHGQ